MTCLSRNGNQHKENQQKPHIHTHAHYAACAFSACDEQTTIDGFYSAVRRSNTNPIDALLSTLENVDGDLLPFVRLNMSTDGELSALSLFYGPTHLATGRLAGWEPLRCGIHPRSPCVLNRVGSFFPNLSTYLEHTGALSSCYCHLYIHSVLSADRYYGLDCFGSFTINPLIVHRFSIKWLFDLAQCARSRDLRHAMTNFSVASCRKFGGPDEPPTVGPEASELLHI